MVPSSDTTFVRSFLDVSASQQLLVRIEVISVLVRKGIGLVSLSVVHRYIFIFSWVCSDVALFSQSFTGGWHASRTDLGSCNVLFLEPFVGSELALSFCT